MTSIPNGREPLLLPPGSVLQFGDPLGQLMVTKVGVIVGEEGGVVCVEPEPEPRHCPLCHPSTTRRGGRGICGRCRASYRGRGGMVLITPFIISPSGLFGYAGWGRPCT
jgi:hypothetical protein